MWINAKSLCQIIIIFRMFYYVDYFSCSSLCKKLFVPRVFRFIFLWALYNSQLSIVFNFEKRRCLPVPRPFMLRDTLQCVGVMPFYMYAEWKPVCEKYRKKVMNIYLVLLSLTFWIEDLSLLEIHSGISHLNSDVVIRGYTYYAESLNNQNLSLVDCVKSLGLDSLSCVEEYFIFRLPLIESWAWCL